MNQTNARLTVLPQKLMISITLDDIAAINILNALPTGIDRDEFVRTATTIGIKMMQTAVGYVDKDVISMEVSRVIDSMTDLIPKTSEMIEAGFQDSVKGLLAQQQDWYNKMVATVETIKGKRAERSTAAGVIFENTVSVMLAELASGRDDDFQNVSKIVGEMDGRMVGDFVVTLSQENGSAAGCKIVFEAKDKKKSRQEIVDELLEARTNREAEFGVMIMSQRSAGMSAQPITRLNDNNLLVVLDLDDPSCHTFLNAAYSIARALVFRASTADEAVGFDLKEFDAAICEITGAVDGVSEMVTWTNTICSNGQKLRDRLAKTENSLRQQIDTFNDLVSQIKAGA